jgi:hypothetical protein
VSQAPYAPHVSLHPTEIPQLSKTLPHKAPAAWQAVVASSRIQHVDATQTLVPVQEQETACSQL